MKIIHSSKKFAHLLYHPRKNISTLPIQQIKSFLEPYVQPISSAIFTIEHIKPTITTMANHAINFQSVTNLPWWGIIIFSCLAMRIPLYPLNKLTRKLFCQFPIWPTLKWVILAVTTLDPTSIVSRFRLAIKSMREMTKKESESTPLYLFHKVFHYPFVGIMSYALYEISARGVLDNIVFLHLVSLSAIDPYFVLPILTVCINYINCSRFIYKSNRHQLVTKLRIFCRSLLIVTLPILCCLPSSVNIFLLTNACFTLLQNRYTSPKRGLRILRVILFFASILLTIGVWTGQIALATIILKISQFTSNIESPKTEKQKQQK